MGFTDRQRCARARLEMETLEDRTTPAKLDEALALALPELVATGAILGDRVNVVMTSETTSAADAAALAAAPFADSVLPLGFGIYSVTLTPGTDLVEAIEYYGEVTGVVSAAPDEIIQIQQTPNDPQYAQLYGMTKIGAPAAWDTSTGNASFVVGVIDTGVDYNHPDLYLNVWINQAEIPSAVRAQLTDTDGDSIISFRDLNNPVNIGAGKIIDGNGNGRIDGGDLLRTAASGGWADGTDAGANGFTDDLVGWDFANNDNNPFDDNNHGTHVAGTIGAIGNNGVGVAGVNWSVSIAGLKFLTASGSGSISGATAALNYAVTAGIKVTNNSWGGGGFSSAMSTAISRARDAGHIFVAAAGNSASNNDATPNYPSNYNFDNVVAVAATDQNDNLASFSSFGATTVDLAAPGVGIRSTTPNNTYANFNGTSMATPHVAGAIALYWGANPTLTYQEVIAKLKSSVDVIPSLNGRVATGGRLNVAKMFATSPPTVPPPPTVAPGPKVTAAAFTGTPNVQFTGVRVTFNRAINANTFTAEDVALTGPNGAITNVSIAPVAGTTTQFDVGFVGQTAGTYSITIGPDVRDTLGNPMNQDGDAVAGELNGDRFSTSATLVTTVTRTFATPLLSLAINDFATTVSTINVTDDVRISDLNARVTLTHTYDSDLRITLTSPTGTTVTLFNRRGGSGDNLTNTRFDDEAGTAIANGVAPFNGTYRPDGLLSAFDGQSTKGTWTLRVTDNATFDVGRLTGWSLTASGTLGAGGLSVRAFGFLADPATFDESAPEPLGESIAVTSAAPIGAASTEPAPAEAADDSASAVFVWMSADDGPSESDAPPVVEQDFVERENRPALSAEYVPVPLDVPYETLFLAPDARTEGEEDVFEAFAME